MKNTIRAEIIRLYEQKGVRGVWVGGAAGVDTWAAEIVLDLLHQNQYHELDLYVAIPFPDHGEAFEPKQKERYQRILSECTDSIVVCKTYRPDSYKKRNYYMVDHSSCGIAVYDLNRSIRSGTGMTYNYAVKKKNIPVVLIHPDNCMVSQTSL